MNRLFTALALYSLLIASFFVAPAPAQSRSEVRETSVPESPMAPSAQTDITGPTGSGSFGSTVTVLPNGNIVVSDPGYSIPAGAARVGAVYLYNGATLTSISTLIGSSADDQVGIGGVTVLTNGNYVINSRNWNSHFETNVGAVTFGNAVSGVSGVVSSSNSLIGSSFDDNVGLNGVTALTNGNYVVNSPDWDNPLGAPGDRFNVGAVTFGNGASGISGVVSSSNSLIGTSQTEAVGNGGVIALANGNYLVRIPNWSSSSASVGAVTFGNGTSGISGVVSSSNSLIGLTRDDQIGGGGVTALTNGNYVVRSPDWDNSLITDFINTNFGAVTFGNGLSGIRGIVSAGNSLIGSTAGDEVGSSGVTALTNGNYVVRSPNWDIPETFIGNQGAVTFGNGMSGISGVVSLSNSLIGSTASDQVGNGGVTALTNGNFVVRSPVWDNPSTSRTDVGAATFGSGVSGISGTVSSSNSLIGSTAIDVVGANGVTALTNGNYVVNSPNWNNPLTLGGDVGAVTFGTGTSGISGVVSSSNSMIGSTEFDFVGSDGVTALTNGNYVVSSKYWSNPSPATTDVGAVTFRSGTSGISAVVSSSNSLIGSTENDNVGSAGVTALTNGNYVVRSPNWDNPSVAKGDEGAVTFGKGSSGISGVVSSSNSLIGSTSDNNIGLSGVTALTNGNYVVRSRNWSSPSAGFVGAVSFGNGLGGVSGVVSSSNSLIGSTLGDNVGFNGVTALTNGNYVVPNQYWTNPSPTIPEASAVTFGNGASGTFGTIVSGTGGGNSVVGTVASGTNTFAFDATRNRLFVGRSASNTVSILSFTTTAIADGDISNPANWSAGVPNGLLTGIIPTGRSMTISSVVQAGQIQVQCGGNLTGGSASAYIVGSIRRDFCSAAGASFTYPLGDANNYSPLTLTNTNGTGALTAAVTDDFLPGVPKALSLSRLWSLTGSGITTNLTFNYVDADVSGMESSYLAYKRNSSTNITVPVSGWTVNAAANTFTVTGVSQFSDWGAGNGPFAPTAAGVSVSGRVLTNTSRGLSNAVVVLTDINGDRRTARSTSFGYYRFDDVLAGETYTMTISSKRFTFTPRLVSVVDELADIDFVAEQ